VYQVRDRRVCNRAYPVKPRHIAGEKSPFHLWTQTNWPLTRQLSTNGLMGNAQIPRLRGTFGTLCLASEQKTYLGPFPLLIRDYAYILKVIARFVVMRM
jgi:hypothetical protein